MILFLNPNGHQSILRLFWGHRLSWRHGIPNQSTLDPLVSWHGLGIDPYYCTQLVASSTLYAQDFIINESIHYASTTWRYEGYSLLIRVMWIRYHYCQTRLLKQAAQNRVIASLISPLTSWLLIWPWLLSLASEICKFKLIFCLRYADCSITWFCKFLTEPLN